MLRDPVSPPMLQHDHRADILCVDVPRAQTVHPDPLRAQLTCHAARHLQHGRFRRVVRHPGVVLQRRDDQPPSPLQAERPSFTHLIRNGAAHARDKNDAPSVPETRHLPSRRLRSKQDAIHVDVYDLHEQ